MGTRRSFLGALAAGVAAASVRGREARAAGSAKPPLGLQLWSVREQLGRDLPGMLRQIKAWGIDEVETAGFHGRTAAEFAQMLKDAGLGCRAMHVGWEALEGQLPALLRDADALSATTLVNPSLPHAAPQATREEMMRAASAFAGWAKQCKAAGKRFAYHLHGQEFGPAPTGTLFDVLAEESGPDVGFELDVFWVVAAGADPLDLMKRYAGRVWFTHLKDMSKDMAARGAAANVPLGTGRIDIRGIVAAGAAAGVLVHYIEDESEDPVAHIPQSAAFYKSL